MDKEEKIQMIIKYKDDVDILVHQKYHKLAQSYGLSLEQYHLLLELDDFALDVTDASQPITVGEVAKNINRSQNTVSEMITRLENKGLVKRIKDSSDRRISRVVLTEEGRDLLELIDKHASSRFLINALSGMKEKEIDDFLGCYEKLIEQMNAIK